MSRFIDEYLPSCVAGYPCISSPRWNTSLVSVDSGAESANQRWAHPLHKFTLPNAVRKTETVYAVRSHWLVMRGPYHTWPWRDPLDFASVQLTKPNVEPSISDQDESLGVGDDIETEFQIYRTYRVGSQTYRRKIELPILSSVKIGYVPPSDQPSETLPPYTVTRPGGKVVFSYPPPQDMILTIGYLFDTCVRFESDESFDGVLQSLHVAGYSDLTFIETRAC